MITDAFNALYTQPKQKQRDENLVSKLLATVRDGGDVMIVRLVTSTTLLNYSNIFR